MYMQIESVDINSAHVAYRFNKRFNNKQ